MAKTSVEKTEKTPLYKGQARFEVVGEVGKIGDWTYKIDERSDSGYLYSSVRLNINAGEGNTVSVEGMGGYSPNKPSNVIKVRSKDGSTRFDVDWSDRNNESILESVSDYDFITVALEKDTHDKLFYKKFLSMYDAVDYIKEHLREGMVVKARGNFAFSEYNGTTQLRKTINSIILSTAKPEEYKSTFIQTVLLDDKSLDKSHAKADKTIDVNAKVVDYDKIIRKNRPFEYTYKVALVDGKESAMLAMIKKFLTVGKDIIREIVVEGNLFEGADVGEVQMTEIPQDLLDLIECGIYTEEEIRGKMAVRGNKVTRLFITKPYVQKNKEGIVQTFVDDAKFTLEDLFVTPNEPETDASPKASESSASGDVPPFEADDSTASNDENDLDWMKELDM